MSWNHKSPELAAGATFGCWTVLRLAHHDRHGRRHYAIRASCCGREKVRLQYHLERSTAERCVGCASKARWVARKALVKEVGNG